MSDLFRAGAERRTKDAAFKKAFNLNTGKLGTGPNEDYDNELLVILMEECSEVIHRASKCLRFGKTEDNTVRLSEEIGDVMYIVQLLSLQGIVSQHGTGTFGDKLRKLRRYMTNKPR